VERLAFRQGPLPPLKKTRVRAPPPSSGALARARAALSGIEDEDLRESLARLGARVIDERAQ